MKSKTIAILVLLIIGVSMMATGIQAQETTTAVEFSDLLSQEAEKLSTSEGVGSSVKIALLLGTLSLAPAIILMTTSYVRIVVVLSLLRQAFGAQQLPPTQVITALSMFLTLVVMAPVWNEVKREAIDPYSDSTEQVSWEEAWERGIVPVKKFMSRQIQLAGNTDSIALFYQYSPELREQAAQKRLSEGSEQESDQYGQADQYIQADQYMETGQLPSTETAPPIPSDWDEVPLNVLLPAFMISELKVAFLLGFQIFLPFLVLDLVVSSVTVSTGMLMLPPTMVSFPLKLILFVMVDGWNLVVGMLLQSFGPFA